MMMKGEERRKHIRIFLPGGQVRLVSGPLLALIGKVINISIGGIKFSCESEVNVGDSFDLEITLPNSLKFKCTAKIVYVETIENNENQVVCGAQFVNLSTREQIDLGEFILKMRAEQDNILKNELN
ncbi:MAG: PilZ domain-containing protein [Elusimicrobiota bacterium]